MPKISIIVPIYNMEKHLRTCVDSLLRQNVDCEIILVNDGSKDASAAICDDYAAKHDFIRVIHKENGGLSMARNSGLEIAAGEYIYFIDSDDWIDPGMLEGMLDLAEKHGADMVVTGISCDFADTGHSVRNSVDESGFYSGREGCRKAIFLIEKAELFPFAHNKLYRHSLLRDNQLRFEKINGPIEDILFNLLAVEKVNGIAILSGAPYHYMQYGTPSLARKHYPHMFEMTMRVNENRRAMYRAFGMTSDEEMDVCAFSCFRQFFHCVKNLYNCKGNVDPMEKKQVWNHALRDPRTRDDILRSANKYFPAKIMRIAVSLRFKPLASGFIACVLNGKRVLGPMYARFRDQVVTRRG